MEMKFWRIAAGFGLALGSALILTHPGSPALAQDDDIVNEFEGDPEGIAYGKERFGARCVYCHGGGGRGAKGPNLVDNKWKFGGSNEQLFYTIAAGLPNTQMGAFGTTLDGDEIWKIIAYMRDENRKWNEEKAAEAANK